ncbi:MAG: MBL fold metallo-hydrolase [Planctomycetota bacterium]|nr:MBL fold metallo-hydrolase [Planctomycetota bacterium]MDA1213547.1 MBL fold metallo-hydrolase [Planctomycetota bacterium]
MQQLGNFQLTTISGGQFVIDGGTMFGVVPKTMWSRLFPADDHNNILQETNCVLVQTGDQNILIDTGYGSKLAPKLRKIFAAAEGDPLLKNLNAAGLDADDIDLVILSHLHFDHAGGATRIDENGELVPTFPNARYIAQRREWMYATAGLPELRGAYPQENLLPLAEHQVIDFIDGDVEIVPGIRSLVTGGHTYHHMAIVIESGDEGAVYLGDLCPTSRHLPTLWGIAYDLDVLQLRRKKPEVLGMIADRGWWALWDHDPDHAAGKLVRDDRRDFAMSDGVKAL